MSPIKKPFSCRVIIWLNIFIAIVAHITGTVRGVKLEVVLPEVLMTQGPILVYQLRSLDFKARRARRIETAPDVIIDEVDALVTVITR